MFPNSIEKEKHLDKNIIVCYPHSPIDVEFKWTLVLDDFIIGKQTQLEAKSQVNWVSNRGETRQERDW